MKKKTAEFQIYGIFGHPLGHTLSPKMQEAAFASLGIKAFYLPFELEPRVFKSVFQGLSPDMLSGFNVTVPFKEKAADLLKNLSPDAKFLNAVNTVFFKGGKWCGENTDVYGFTEALTRDAKFRAKGKEALILGAGGSARAVIFGLCQLGIGSLVIVNRTQAKARKLQLLFSKRFPKVRFETAALENFSWKEKVAQADLVVNTTSVGLKYSDVSLLPAEAVPDKGAKKLFFDLIYKPSETDFLSKAKLKKHETMNGLGMLLYQGAKSFECWTQHKAPVSLMREALSKALQEI